MATRTDRLMDRRHEKLVDRAKKHSQRFDNSTIDIGDTIGLIIVDELDETLYEIQMDERYIARAAERANKRAKRAARAEEARRAMQKRAELQAVANLPNAGLF